jgi:phage terminase small subunit
LAKLRDKQQRFVEEYLVDFNATQAAIRAGYSKRTAGKIGTENLQKPAIQGAIRAAQAQLSKKTEVTREMIVAGLLKEAEFYEDGCTHGARVKAWEVLGKHVGMFDRQGETDTSAAIALLKAIGEGYRK